MNGVRKWMDGSPYHWCSKVLKAQNPHQNTYYYLCANQYQECQTCLSAPCCFTPLFYFQRFFSCKNSCFVHWCESFEAPLQHCGFRGNTRRVSHDALPWHQCALGLKTVFWAIWNISALKWWRHTLMCNISNILCFGKHHRGKINGLFVVFKVPKMLMRTLQLGLWCHMGRGRRWKLWCNIC